MTQFEAIDFLLKQFLIKTDNYSIDSFCVYNYARILERLYSVLNGDFMAYEKTIWQIDPSGKAICVKFLGRTDFTLAKYYKISMEGFSCFCDRPLQIGETNKVEVNLKMLTSGAIDDFHPHIATAKLIGFEEVDGKQVCQFRFINFEEDCFDNLMVALSFLDSKEKVVPMPVAPKTQKGSALTIDSVISAIIEKVVKGQIILPVLPKIVQEIEKLYKHPDTTIDDLAKVIERDAVISVKVLATANSPFYRTDSQIKTVRETIPRLGFKATRNLVLTIANKSLYQVKNRLFKQYFEKLWKHSLVSAHCSKAIAESKGYKSSELFYLAGLFHDIGKIVLFRFLSDVFPKKIPFSENDIIEAAERYNSKMGNIILGHWGFPGKFVNAITTPHNENVKNRANKVSLVIDTANVLARNMGYDLSDVLVELPEVDSVKLLNIKLQTLNGIADHVKTMMESSENVF